MRKIILAILIVLVVAEGSYIAYQHVFATVKKNVATVKTNEPVLKKLIKPKPASPKQSPVLPPNTVLVVFDKYGFEPNQFEVPVGTTVMVKNESSSQLKFEPLSGQPNQISGMYLGDIAVNASASFLLDTTGSWQFEANANPALRGNVTSTAAGQSSVSLNNNELPKYNPTDHSLLLNYTDYGFLPNIVSVPVGTKVTVLNSTNEGGMQFEELSSDSSKNPALNLGILEKGQSKTFTLTVKGNWHYENTWETTDKGEISAD